MRDGRDQHHRRERIESFRVRYFCFKRVGDERKGEREEEGEEWVGSVTLFKWSSDPSSITTSDP